MGADEEGEVLSGVLVGRSWEVGRQPFPEGGSESIYRLNN